MLLASEVMGILPQTLKNDLYDNPCFFAVR